MDLRQFRTGLRFAAALLALCSCLASYTAAAAPAPTPAASLPFDPSSALAAPAADAHDRRIALVIGNGGYALAPLRNAVNDARAMAAMLRRLGFDVTHLEDATQARMRQALREFGQRLDDGGTGLFYFAGHGAGVAGGTRLLPVDAAGRAAQTGMDDALALREILNGMAVPRPGKRNLVILDICLNNPFESRSAGSIPARDPVPEETLVAYATAPGGFAADGPRHGTYTAQLLRALGEPGLGHSQLFRRVGLAVRHATEGRQQPWVASTLSAEFRFLPQDTPAPALLGSSDADAGTVIEWRSRAILPKDSDEQFELSFWESIKDSTHASDYEAYLNTYPNGRFAALAKARLARLRAAAPKAEPPSVTQPAPAKAPEKAAEKPPEKPAAAERPAISERPAQRPRQPPPAQDAAQARPAPAPTPVPAAVPDSRPAPRQAGGEIRDCQQCPILVSIPAGSFTMGSNTGDPSEKPAHHVTIAKPFAIGKLEVTVEQWDACVDAGGCPRLAGSEQRSKKSPARDISWDDAQQYVKWLSQVTGKPYRLPTEAEWEYAARGGTGSRYWWGEQMRPKMANCKECGDPWDKDGPVDAGTFPPNPFGLHDVNGSVWEWVADCWRNNYAGAPGDGRAWEQPNCRTRVIRGGSWREGASYMPSTTRFKYDASVRQMQNGFRVARPLD
ncbi:SUMF1/EgtB/PvdO family nonheme iron enzyme [Noviherbaspirillum humi]|nr:SUMF1/EgtB/PvdO family nonheme iron enzyme [Noviherbaspirillum humi]